MLPFAKFNILNSSIFITLSLYLPNSLISLYSFLLIRNLSKSISIFTWSKVNISKLFIFVKPSLCLLSSKYASRFILSTLRLACKLLKSLYLNLTSPVTLLESIFPSIPTKDAPPSLITTLLYNLVFLSLLSEIFFISIESHLENCLILSLLITDDPSKTEKSFFKLPLKLIFVLPGNVPFPIFRI